MPAPLKPERVSYIVVHCSASPPKARVDRTVIDRWHRERGWLGIGYHFVINRDGRLEKGREVEHIGAHVQGYNDRSVGVCLVGGVDEKLQPEANFTDAQYTALRTLLWQLKHLFPDASVVGHHDLDPKKACPSFDVKEWWALNHNAPPA